MNINDEQALVVYLVMYIVGAILLIFRIKEVNKKHIHPLITIYWGLPIAILSWFAIFIILFVEIGAIFKEWLEDKK